MKKRVSYQTILLMALDAAAMIAAGGLALLVRFDFTFEKVPAQYLEPWFRTLPIQIAVMLVVFWLLKMYHFIWRCVSVRDVMRMSVSIVLAYLAFHVPACLLGYRQPRGVLFAALMCQLFFLIGIRCSLRFLGEMRGASQINGRVLCAMEDNPGNLPGVYQLVNGEVSLAAVKDVQIEDLLGREPVKLDTTALLDFLEGKIVMVTGGGGSIGSELCRQIARYHPRQLIILDIYENNAYDIQQELRRTWGSNLNLSVEIASVRDKERIYDIFQACQVDIVFHAAAHKHVPLMELCPEEAIKNNIFGTYHVVRAAEKFGVKKFVMISTDKAVNPTNCMGATKRFCEMIIQSRADSPTEFCAVRFGNVLGSNGSVVPLFKRQIAEGGPVTITDKRIIRYFMTIPEAAQLVLEAGAMAKRSQIFVLDMGEPVRILTLAEDLIRLSGLKPYEDIEIREVGLRPGEKLYEELLMKSRNLSKTSNEKIFIEQQQVISREMIMDSLVRLDEAVTQKWPPKKLIALLRDMVPTYLDPAEVNSRAVSRPVTEEAEDYADAKPYLRDV